MSKIGNASFGLSFYCNNCVALIHLAAMQTLDQLNLRATVDAKRDEEVKVVGLDIGFSTTRPSAGVGLFDGRQVKTTHCYGIGACSLIVRSGRYDIAAIDGPVVPKDYDINETRAVERVFCKGLFQKRCKPGMSHIPNTGVRLREGAGNAANLLFDALDDPHDISLFPRVRKGPIIEAFPNAFLGVCLDDDVFAAMPSLQVAESSIGYTNNGNQSAWWRSSQDFQLKNVFYFKLSSIKRITMNTVRRLFVF